MPYLHGAYGEIGDSKVTEVRQGSVICAYIGTAPVNLVLEGGAMRGQFTGLL